MCIIIPNIYICGKPCLWARGKINYIMSL